MRQKPVQFEMDPFNNKCILVNKQGKKNEILLHETDNSTFQNFCIFQNSFPFECCVPNTQIKGRSSDRGTKVAVPD